MRKKALLPEERTFTEDELCQLYYYSRDKFWVVFNNIETKLKDKTITYDDKEVFNDAYFQVISDYINLTIAFNNIKNYTTKDKKLDPSILEEMKEFHKKVNPFKKQLQVVLPLTHSEYVYKRTRGIKV